jgi:adenylate cyclase class 2
MIETEIKFPVGDLGVVRKKLRDLKADFEAAFFEDNIVFDDEKKSLHDAGKILRLRQGDRVLLTFKSPVTRKGETAQFKIMEELEIEVSDFSRTAEIVTSLGYMKVFRYQKNREIYNMGEVLILLDETPIGNFIEIEGAERGIAEACDKLQLVLAEGTTKNYLELYREYCERNNLKPSDMVFNP